MRKGLESTTAKANPSPHALWCHKRRHDAIHRCTCGHDDRKTAVAEEITRDTPAWKAYRIQEENR